METEPPISPCYFDETLYNSTECDKHKYCQWDKEHKRCRIRQGSLDELGTYECRTNIYPQQCSERFGRDYKCVRHRCQRFTGMFFVPFTDKVMYGKNPKAEMEGDRGLYAIYGLKDSPIFYTLLELGWIVSGSDNVSIPNVGMVKFVQIEGPHQTKEAAENAIKLDAETLGVEAVMAKDRIEGKDDPFQENMKLKFKADLAGRFQCFECSSKLDRTRQCRGCPSVDLCSECDDSNYPLCKECKEKEDQMGGGLGLEWRLWKRKRRKEEKERKEIKILNKERKRRRKEKRKEKRKRKEATEKFVLDMDQKAERDFREKVKRREKQIDERENKKKREINENRFPPPKKK